MDGNPWKLAAIGPAVMGTTALGTGLTTAFTVRPPAATPGVTTPAATTPVVTVDCTGTDRAMRIARPGAIGGLLGAGLGAAGGAIATVFGNAPTTPVAHHGEGITAPPRDRRSTRRRAWYGERR